METKVQDFGCTSLFLRRENEKYLCNIFHSLQSHVSQLIRVEFDQISPSRKGFPKVHLKRSCHAIAKEDENCKANQDKTSTKRL